jgi:hypothetical protein
MLTGTNPFRTEGERFTAFAKAFTDYREAATAAVTSDLKRAREELTAEQAHAGMYKEQVRLLEEQRDRETSLIPKPQRTERRWVNCPVCGEPDMRRESDSEGNTLILCVNHACASNGGTNADVIEMRFKDKLTAAQARAERAEKELAAIKQAVDAWLTKIEVENRSAEDEIHSSWPTLSPFHASQLRQILSNAH